MTRKEMYLPIEKADKNAAPKCVKKRKPRWANVIKIEALAEDGKPEEMSTSETVCSFS